MDAIERRLARLEAAEARRRWRVEVTAIAAEFGQSYAEFMEEAETFFRLPLAEQLAEVDQIQRELQAEGMTMDDIDEIKATLTTHDRPMV
jgi:hypothetical protein